MKRKEYSKHFSPELKKKLAELETGLNFDNYDILKNSTDLTTTQKKALTKIETSLRAGNKAIYNPEQLYHIIQEYKIYVENQCVEFQIPKTDINGNVISIQKKKPPTIFGFCLFADIPSMIFWDYMNGKGREGHNIKEYIYVAHELTDYINNYLLEGSITGDINANIAKFAMINQGSGFQDVTHIEVNHNVDNKPKWLKDTIQIEDADVID